MEKVNSKALKELKGILTDEQLEKYKQLRKELKEQKANQEKSAIITDEDQEMKF